MRVLPAGLVDLCETSTDNGDKLLCIATPGWGSSGFYSAEVLKRDGPNAFTEGTHTYLDHPTQTDRMERPERSLRDLAGTLTEDARWLDSGWNGAGLYATAKVTSEFRPLLDELQDDIGVSMRAPGVSHFGEADGRKGQIVDSIGRAFSVDYVTKAGRGGKVAKLLKESGVERPEPEMTEAELEEAGSVGQWMEARMHSDFTQIADSLYGDGYLDRDERITLSAGLGAALESFVAKINADAPQLFNRSRWDEPNSPMEEAMPLTAEERTELVEAATAAAVAAITPIITEAAAAESPATVELREALNRSAAVDHVRTRIAGRKGLPAHIAARALAAATVSVPLTEAKAVDFAKLDENADAAITAEVDYLKESGVDLSGIKDAGATTTPVVLDESKIEAEMVDTFARLGLSKEAAATAAAGH